MGKLDQALTTLTEIENLFPDDAARAAWQKAVYLKEAGDKKQADRRRQALSAITYKSAPEAGRGPHDARRLRHPPGRRRERGEGTVSPRPCRVLPATGVATSTARPSLSVFRAWSQAWELHVNATSRRLGIHLTMHSLEYQEQCCRPGMIAELRPSAAAVLIAVRLAAPTCPRAAGAPRRRHAPGPTRKTPRWNSRPTTCSTRAWSCSSKSRKSARSR